MVLSDERQSDKPSACACDCEQYPQKKVLIADPGKRIVKYTRRILEKHLGCRVDAAHDAHQAMSLLDSTAYDAVIYNMALPGIEAFDLPREARSAFPYVGIIATSDNTIRFPYVRAIRSGATDFMAKPYLPAEVLAKTVRVFHEAALQEQRRLESLKYKGLFDLSIDGMALLDGGGAVIEDVNRSLLELMGEKKANLVGKPASMLLDTDDRYRFEQWLSLCALIGRGAISDLKLAHATEATVYVDISMAIIKNEAQSGIFLVVKNITERREMQLRLDEITQRDLLTGLFNRRSFVSRIHAAVRSVQEYNIPTTLMLLDIDNMKGFNDTHGHAAGDQILVEAAAAISMHIHPNTGDACFRYDGDEFAVLLTGIDVDEGRQVAKYIQDEFYSRDTKGVTMSIGLAAYQNDHTVEDFVRAAETAVVEAKATGKSTISAARG